MKFTFVILAVAVLLTAGAVSARLPGEILDIPEEMKKNAPPGTYWDEELGVFVFDPPIPVMPPQGALLGIDDDPMIWFDDGVMLYFIPIQQNYFALTKMPTPECRSGEFQILTVWLACYNSYESQPDPGVVYIYGHEVLGECAGPANPYADKVGDAFAYRNFVGEPFDYENNQVVWTVIPFDDDPDNPVVISEDNFWVAMDYRGIVETFGSAYTVGDFRLDIAPSEYENRFFEGSSDYCPTLLPSYGAWMIRATGRCVGELVESPIDIKPRSCPNPFGIKQKGVTPVAILGTDDLDVMDIDPSTIYLEGVPPLRWAYEDVARPFPGELCDCWTEGPDGHMDLTIKFDSPALLEALQPVSDGDILTLELVWELNDLTPMVGYDCMIIRDRGKGPQSFVDLFDNKTFALFQNSPNPFKSGTSICFSLPEKSHTTLTVHDLSGRLVSVVADGEFAAGAHTVEWNADVPSGIYFYRIKAGELSAGRRMVVLR